ncbi:hypothetical protein [Helicobacter sp. 11S02629-2]|uniref:hypothetical protein n=1 Tax=Helicobacter sp. 11S02629-2 TaxID=1476195 RepID=UPI000BA6E14A|nr:hypothetical protein [Helicobacter sp. 11S02629-2]PAF45597.1 hypothetical protein BKH40_01575 [Helicobacter sp. 11S02629-2]
MVANDIKNGIHLLIERIEKLEDELSQKNTVSKEKDSEIRDLGFKISNLNVQNEQKDLRMKKLEEQNALLTAQLREIGELVENSTKEYKKP